MVHIPTIKLKPDQYGTQLSNTVLVEEMEKEKWESQGSPLHTFIIIIIIIICRLLNLKIRKPHKPSKILSTFYNAYASCHEILCLTFPTLRTY